MSADELARRRVVKTASDRADVAQPHTRRDVAKSLNAPLTRPALYGSVAQRSKIILDYLAKRQRAKLYVVPEKDRDADE